MKKRHLASALLAGIILAAAGSLLALHLQREREMNYWIQSFHASRYLGSGNLIKNPGTDFRDFKNAAKPSAP
ncbi:hypothetical protein [Sphingomonas sp. Root241]|uniref:hypothetical protein n=1 Tax=Sphingomonas sp. Root241 TaxID=1736501 RepID=UPI0012E3F853|nr:hypothetical protein [Sphingomonas sp. Root241]